MEILMIDDEKEYIEQTIRMAKFVGDVEIIPGESKTFIEALRHIQRNKPKVILLDSYFDDKLVGPDIAGYLQEDGFTGLVISYSTASREDQKKTYKDYPIVKHFVRKSPFELKKCLKGTCDCAALI